MRAQESTKRPTRIYASIFMGFAVSPDRAVWNTAGMAMNRSRHATGTFRLWNPKPGEGTLFVRHSLVGAVARSWLGVAIACRASEGFSARSGIIRFEGTAKFAGSERPIDRAT